MSLIKSISGFRGTIGGRYADNLTPIDIVELASAYGSWLKIKSKQKKLKVIIGRDARISGKMVSQLVSSTLQGLGIDIIDLGLSTTPTVEFMVPKLSADGGIIITASHNPKQWNALKLLNIKGEFISAKDGALLLEIIENKDFEFAKVDDLGKYQLYETAIEEHINAILDYPLIQKNIIINKKFKVVVDSVNSTGGISVPLILKKLGCEVIEIYCDPNGEFPHNPEPLEEHLSEIMEKVKTENADFGVVVDPDVDRLVFVSEDGNLFGEEYTLVAVSDYVLSKKIGNTVSNLSSSRALKDITEQYGGKYFASAVGEVNVVEKMKEVNAVIGGEGNGGVIVPNFHYGRDALIGIALFLSLIAEEDITVSKLRQKYSQYYMGKNKIELTPSFDIDKILETLKIKYKSEIINTTDGLKIDFPYYWVHLRKSNTEPIIRIYTEANTQKEADDLALRFIDEIMNIK